MPRLDPFWAPLFFYSLKFRILSPMTHLNARLFLCVLLLAAGTGFAQQSEPASEEESDLWIQAQELYELAKAAGEQVPGSLVEWVRQDLEKIGDWEYRVVALAGSAESMEQKLNELGQERWECFSVQADGKQTRFFLKRPAKSYVGSVPVSTLLRLLPGIGDGESSP